MTPPIFKQTWTLDLPARSAGACQDLNLRVQLQRSSCGNCYATLVDMGECRVEGLLQGPADDLANGLEHVVSAIQQLQRSRCGAHAAVLVDIGECRGEGSTQVLAIDDLARELERVVAVRQASGFVSRAAMRRI